MIDTIRIEISDLKKHESLAFGLFRESRFSKYEYRRQVDFEGLKRMPLNMFMDMVRYGDTKKDEAKRMYSKLHIPSSHYHVIYDVCTQRDSIWFEFSIPKYLYGNNVAQFVKSPSAKDLHLYSDKDFDVQLKKVDKNLRKFIRIFFKKQFLDEYIDERCVFVSRIDYCYNQYFQNKDEARDYLELQKKFRKKWTREDSPSHGIYSYGVSYRSKLYYAKIYHKGTEYEKNDKQEHLKINQEIGKRIDLFKQREKDEGVSYKNEIRDLREKMIDVEFIQKQADRILRYEFTFRSSYMSYLYKQNIFRKRCPVFKDNLERFNKLHAKVERRERDVERLSKEIRHMISKKMNVEEQEKQLKEANVFLSKEERIVYKDMQKRMSKRHKFYLDVRHIVKSYAVSTPAGDKPAQCWTEAEFSKDLVDLMGKKFKQFIMDFQVKELPPMEAALASIVDYNQRAKDKSKIWKKEKEILGFSELDSYGLRQKRESRLKSFLVLMERYSMDEIKKLGLFSRMSIYRYTQDLKKICNVDERSLQPANGVLIIPRTDFSDYYIFNMGTFKLFLNNYDNCLIF